ncbi:MAG: caspase family protein [Sideroxyarcus sp.]|nr:caspase family protein [Sideroxyarcus sp.]
MKRKALLIGNTGGLNGVALDVERMAEFLKSRTGGAWLDHEIEPLMNPKKAALQSSIQRIKAQAPDYLVLLFSGHGAHDGQTILELNGNGETIEESALQKLALRQLSIFDCCRVGSEQVKKAMLAMDSLAFRESFDPVRERYDNRIMQAIPQQVRLYACAVDQCSYDTPNGALYLNNLLTSAQTIDTSATFKTVELAHAEAREKTVAQAKYNKDGPQTPQAYLPKCLTTQQLIISLK